MRTAKMSAVPDDYLDLVRQFPLRPIRTEAEHEEAGRVLTGLLGRPSGKLSPGERDYVDALSRFMEDYDARDPFPGKPLSPLEALKALMKNHEMTTEDLGKILGNKTAASLVLNGKRELSKNHIRRLAARFKVSAGLFI